MRISGTEMNDGKPEWYVRLNKNEKRIVDIFMESKGWYLIARPVLDERLCKTKLMNQRTLTDRLDYLIEKGIIGRAIGKKGAVFYAPKFIIEMARDDPQMDVVIDSQSPKSLRILSMTVKVACERVSDERMCESLIRSAECWEQVGVGSDREKEKVYQNLRRLRKGLVRKALRTREDDP